MPFLDRDKQREYQARWTKKRRTDWLAENGPCRRCGSLDRLEVHHRDPAEKVSHRVWTWSAARRLVELAKCDVLCHACHLEETKKHLRRPIPHGTRAGYKRGCRCSACRTATVDYNRTWISTTNAKRGKVVGPRMVKCEVCTLDISYLGKGRPPRYCSKCGSSRQEVA